MPENVIELIKLMKSIHAEHLQLVKLGEGKKEFLLKNDIYEMERTVSMENIIIERIAALENKRMLLVRQIVGLRNDSSEDINLDEVFMFVNGQERIDLESVRSDLMKTLMHLKEVNAMNSQLTRISLGYVDYMVNIIVGVRADSNTYSPGRRESDSESRYLMDWKA